jgi:hypothetical protein
MACFLASVIDRSVALDDCCNKEEACTSVVIFVKLAYALQLFFNFHYPNVFEELREREKHSYYSPLEQRHSSQSIMSNKDRPPVNPHGFYNSMKSEMGRALGRLVVKFTASMKNFPFIFRVFS